MRQTLGGTTAITISASYLSRNIGNQIARSNGNNFKAHLRIHRRLLASAGASLNGMQESLKAGDAKRSRVTAADISFIKIKRL